MSPSGGCRQVAAAIAQKVDAVLTVERLQLRRRAIVSGGRPKSIPIAVRFARTTRIARTPAKGLSRTTEVAARGLAPPPEKFIQ